MNVGEVVSLVPLVSQVQLGAVVPLVAQVHLMPQVHLVSLVYLMPQAQQSPSFRLRRGFDTKTYKQQFLDVVLHENTIR